MGAVVACIGMGLLGSALAENLIRAGFTVRGYDIAPERMREHAARGGVPADSPADAARGADTVLTCLMTADIVREALLGTGWRSRKARRATRRARRSWPPRCTAGC